MARKPYIYVLHENVQRREKESVCYVLLVVKDCKVFQKDCPSSLWRPSKASLIKTDNPPSSC